MVAKTGTAMATGTAMIIPPKLESLQKEGNALLARAQEIKVTSEATHEEAVIFMRGVKTLERDIKAEMKLIKDPQNEALKRMRELENKLLRIPAAAEELVDPQVLAWRRKKRLIQEERDRKAREEAEARALKEREAEEKRLAKLAKKDPNAAEKLEELKEEPLVVDAVDTKPALKKVDGGAARQIWDFEIFDKTALLQAVIDGKVSREFIKISREEIGKVVRASKGQVSIPGVRPFQKESSSYSSL